MTPEELDRLEAVAKAFLRDPEQPCDCGQCDDQRTKLALIAEVRELRAALDSAIGNALREGRE